MESRLSTMGVVEGLPEAIPTRAFSCPTLHRPGRPIIRKGGAVASFVGGWPETVPKAGPLSRVRKMLYPA